MILVSASVKILCIYLVCLLYREAVLWMSVKHQNKKAVEIWAKEIAAAGTGGEK